MFENTLSAIRLRPAMYVGDRTSRGLHVLFGEVLDNAIDQFRAGLASRIIVTLHEDGALTCEDDGPGIPCDSIPEFDGRSYLEVVVTETFAGGRLTKGRYGAGKFNGMGMLVVNALSESLTIETTSHGERWRIHCEAGRVIDPIAKIENTNKLGTRLSFQPDRTIFPETRFDPVVLRNRLRELSYLFPRLAFELTVEATARHEVFHCLSGPSDFVLSKTANREVLLPAPIQIADSATGLDLKAAFTYLTVFDECDLHCYANTEQPESGGVHVDGFLQGLLSAITDFGDRHEWIKWDHLRLDFLREGLVGLVAIELPDAQYEGPTRGRLSNREVLLVVESMTRCKLLDVFYRSPEVAFAIIQHLNTSFADYRIAVENRNREREQQRRKRKK